MAVATPAFQPYRGATGRAWMAEEYGIIADTSSLMSSGTERDDTDDEICSFDLGPEPFDPQVKIASRLMSFWTITNKDFNPEAQNPDA